MPKVLLVDDKAIVREPIAAALELIEMDVLCSASGFSAIEILGKNSVDIVLLDVRMPDMDGLETLEVIRKELDLRLLPIVMLTGVADRNVIWQAARLGISGYLLKRSFSLSTLERKIRDAIEPTIESEAVRLEELRGKPENNLGHTFISNAPPGVTAPFPPECTRSKDGLGFDECLQRLLQLTTTHPVSMDGVCVAAAQNQAISNRIAEAAGQKSPHGGASPMRVRAAISQIGVNGVRDIVKSLIDTPPM